MAIGPTIENLRRKRADEAALLEMLYSLPTPTGGFDVNTPAERRQLAERGLRGGEPYSDGRMDYGRQRPVQATIDVMPPQPAEFYAREVSRDILGPRATNDLFGYPQGTGTMVGDMLLGGGLLGLIGAKAPLTAWDAGTAAAQGNYGDAAMKSAFSLLEGAGLGELATGARGIKAVANEFPELAQEVGQSARRFLSDESGAVPLPFGIGHNNPPPTYPTVDMPAGSRPEYVGAAPDRSGGSYPRYAPIKGASTRMNRLASAAASPNSPLVSMFDTYVNKGTTLGGPDWYNTEELRDWFVSSLGEDLGDKEWRAYIDQIGATSTGSKVPQNVRIASFYRALGDDAPRVAQIVKDEGVTPAEAARRLGITPKNTPDNYDYGHLKQRGHAGNIVNQAAGEWERQPPVGLKGAALSEWLQANPKVKGFTNSLLGNTDNIAADMHFMRMLAMSDGGVDFLNKQAKLNQSQIADLRATYGTAIDPYIKVREIKGGKQSVEVNLKKAGEDGIITDTSAFRQTPSAWADTPEKNEYAAYEALAQSVAKRYGMTPAQFQASLWMGAGDMTNLADESQGTFMDLFRRTLDKRAGERGLTRGQMLDDFIVNRAPLAVAPIGATGLLAMQPNEEQY